MVPVKISRKSAPRTECEIVGNMLYFPKVVSQSKFCSLFIDKEKAQLGFRFSDLQFSSTNCWKIQKGGRISIKSLLNFLPPHQNFIVDGKYEILKYPHTSEPHINFNLPSHYIQFEDMIIPK